MRGLLMANKMGFQSFCPINPGCMWHKQFRTGNHIIKGYETGTHVPGWCIGMTRETFKKIEGFNEEVMFWYSDNIYCEQIKSQEIPHCLVCNSIVFHIESKTLATKTDKEYNEYTRNQLSKYHDAKKRYNL